MKRLFSIALGILTAIGGFVDIGDIVANSETGARFGMSLAWVVVVGVIGICLFAEMAGRVATVSGRAVFDLVRERLGARVALVNLVASLSRSSRDARSSSARSSGGWMLSKVPWADPASSSASTSTWVR